jgi:fructose-1,6-bisphosphatase II
LKKVYTTEDLISTDDVFLLLPSQHRQSPERRALFSGGAFTQSIAMRGRSGTMRWIDARHNFKKLEKLDFMKYADTRRWAQSEH